jgi:hypothetical protein
MSREEVGDIRDAIPRDHAGAYWRPLVEQGSVVEAHERSGPKHINSVARFGSIQIFMFLMLQPPQRSAWL